MARKRKPVVGDRVSFRLWSVIFDDPKPLLTPTVAGTILVAPTDLRNGYYTVELDPSTLPNPEHLAGIEHIRPSEIQGILPRTMSRADVEAWLAE